MAKNNKHFKLKATRTQKIFLPLLAGLFSNSIAMASDWSWDGAVEYRYFIHPSDQVTVVTGGQALNTDQLAAINNFYALLAAQGIDVATLPNPTSLTTTTSPSAGQKDPSIFLEAQYSNQLDSNTRLTFKPFIRFDGQDTERTHYDIRELLWDRKYENGGKPWQLRIGYDKVFWGTAESNHLVDVINQTDLIENIDRTQKLGQPMVRLTTSRSWGTLDMFLLPYFREPTWAGVNGRLRSPQPFNLLPVRYESGAKKYHGDLAVRWSNSYDAGDVGVYYFKGTNRAPRIIQDSTTVTDENPLGLVLNYDQMRQVGFDGNLLVGNWILKSEIMYRYTQAKDFRAAVYGGEYAFTGVFHTPWDVNAFVERSYDSRGQNSEAELQNDVFIGARISLNDIQSTQIKIGKMQDLGYGSQSYRIEASRRIKDNMTLKLEGQYFSHVDDQNDPVYALRADSYIQLSMQFFY